MERRSDQRGISILEVMITLTVLAVGLLAMVTLQIQAMKDGSRGRHTSIGATLARDQLELIQNMPFSSGDLAVMDPVLWTTPPWLDNAGDPTLGPGEIAVQVSQPDGSPVENVFTVFYRVSEGPDADPALRTVDLEVVWDEQQLSDNQPTRTGKPTAAVSTVIVDNDR